MRLPNGYGGVTKLSGNRRRPYIVRKTIGWKYDKDNRYVQEYQIIGYAKTRAEGLQLLAQYNVDPQEQTVPGKTFAQVYEEWSATKFETIAKSNVLGYKGVYKLCGPLYSRKIAELRLADLQQIVDTCDKNYPVLKKLNVLFHQIYEHAMRNEYVDKDYSLLVDINKYRNRNPNKQERDRLSEEIIANLWTRMDSDTAQIVLMLIYSGVRVSELLNLKKEHVHLEEQYFDVVESKTINGIRKVPIADKVLPFYKSRYQSAPGCEYLIRTPKQQHFLYRNFYLHYYKPLLEEMGNDSTPHCCRHTCVSMLAEAHVDQTIIKKIVGHSGAMTLTERVYTHFDIRELIEAINLI